LPTFTGAMSKRIRALRADAWDFYPAILQAQHVPPSPLPRLVLYTLMILFFSYFWVATQFQPAQIADDLKKFLHDSSIEA